MKTILYFENEELPPLYNAQVLKQIRLLYREDFLVVVSAGDFSSGGQLLRPSSRKRSEEYVKCGADLVLSLPISSVLGGYGKKEFAGAALVQRLRTADLLVLPCSPLAGQTVEDCERSLRACAMQMFLAGPDYRRELTGNLAASLPFREAQRRALCTCNPETRDLLSSPVNRQALWLLDAMLQLYYMAKTRFIPAPEGGRQRCGELDSGDTECNHNIEHFEDTDPFDTIAVSKIANLLSTSSMEQLIDIAGSTSQLVSGLIEQKERIRDAGSLEEITRYLLPASPDRSRLFLLKAILGVRNIYMQICSLHVYVPYCYVTAKNPLKTALLQQLETSSWVPFIGDHTQEQDMEKDYFYLLQIDKQAEELIC